MSLKKNGGNTKSSYLALIPKESNPVTFNKYRPISLFKQGSVWPIGSTN